MNSFDAAGAPIAIFGAGGFIGSALATSLRQHRKVVAFRSKDVDLAQKKCDERLADFVPARSVWIAVAAKSPDSGLRSCDILRTNVAITKSLCRLAALSPPRYVLHLSSVDVYGRQKLELPLTESSAIQLETPYAVSKYVSEILWSKLCAKLGIPLAVLRLPGVYGPGDTHSGPVRSFLDAAVHGGCIKICGDGRQVRDLLFINDLIRVVQLFCDRTICETVNCVTGLSISLLTMLRELETYIGYSLDVQHVPGSQHDLRFDVTAIRKATHEIALTPFIKGLCATFDAMQAIAETQSIA